MKSINTTLFLLLSTTCIHAQNVGIGTNVPVQKLHVAGTAYIMDSLGIGIPTPQVKLDVASNGPNAVVGMFRSNGGYAQINVSNGNDMTDLGMSGFAGYVGSATAKDFSIHTGTASHIYIQNSTGNVGINTVAPSESLDVNGNAKISGSLDLGTVYNFTETLQVTGSFESVFATCPAGYQLLGGGGGATATAMGTPGLFTIQYNGPSTDEPATKWRLSTSNATGASQTVRVWCNCARIK